MPSQYKFFFVPARQYEDAEPELNKFLRSHRVVNVRKEFVSHGESSFWSMAVEFLASGDQPGPETKAGRNKVDYREVLAPEDFAVFAKLREWRKEEAAREAAPVYTLFTNEQLAQIACRRPATLTALQDIEGIGEAKAGRYGEALIELVGRLTAEQLQQVHHETDQ